MLAFHEPVLSVVEKAGTFFIGLCQVWYKEMKEMRLNHRRGVVTNSVVAQNRTGQRPEGTSHVNALCLQAVMTGNRRKDGMTLYRAHLRNRGNYPITIEEKLQATKW